MSVSTVLCWVLLGAVWLFEGTFEGATLTATSRECHSEHTEIQPLCSKRYRAIEWL